MITGKSFAHATWGLLAAGAIGVIAACSGRTSTSVDPNGDPTGDGGTTLADGGKKPPTDGGKPPTDGGKPPRDAGSQGCGEWKVGTITGYNNSDLGDDPNAGSVVEFTGLNDGFYDNVPMAAVDGADWNKDQYHWIELDYAGTVARVGAWDMCANEDCPDGRDCCTENKRRFAQPGYLIDVETRTAKRLFGVDNAEDTLNDRVEYRVCGSFDPDEIADQYGARRN